MKGAERSEAPSTLDTIKDKWYEQSGAASSTDCPRKGHVFLQDHAGRRTIVNTVCNSWRCLACRDSNMARFKALVRTGCFSMERCSFITLTYKAGSERLERAGCVARDWKAFWRRLVKKRPELKGIPILRVMELTKKGTPHFHMIVGETQLRARCWGNELREPLYRARMAECDCLAHVFAREWSVVQGGESYIVHATGVRSARGAGAYLAKYMRKEFDSDRAEELGMVRRWSTSRAWPREPRVRLEPRGGWKRSWFSPGHVERLETFKDLDPGLRERRMTENQALESERRAAGALMKMVGGTDEHSDVGKANVSKEHHGGSR